MGTRTGNPAWQAWPSTATPVTAGALQAIENALDATVSSAGLDAATAALVADSASTTAAKVNAAIDGETAKVNAKRLGAKGDGVTDDTAALQAILTAGGHIRVPAGTYMVDAVIGLTMGTANTTLEFAPGAVFQVITNAATSYAAITVSAADCKIIGGTILGDVATHTGTTGEWGHLVITAAGADRLTIMNTRLSGAWGDGIYVGGGADISIINVTCDNNRRQGLSIVSSTRTRVLGGVFKDTGITKTTAPSSGIDVEPNAGGAVTDCLISGVLCQNNTGPNLSIAAATGSTCVVLVVGSLFNGGKADGVYLNGAAGTIRARLVGCSAIGNTGMGYHVNADRTHLDSCTARGNTSYGLQINASNVKLTDPEVIENGGHGLQVSASSIVSTVVVGGIFASNSQANPGAYGNIDDWGTASRFLGVYLDAGALAAKPAYGVIFRAGSSAKMIGCDTGPNAYTSATVSESSGAALISPPLGISTGAPTAAAGANAGTTPPAPVVAAASRQLRGSITFGTGTAPAAGAQVVITFASPLPSAPAAVSVTPTNAATVALHPYVTGKTAAGFTVAFGTAPAASQANTAYALDFAVHA